MEFSVVICRGKFVYFFQTTIKSLYSVEFCFFITKYDILLVSISYFDTNVKLGGTSMITGVIKNKIDKIWTDIRNCFYFLSIELQNQFVIFF